MASPQFVLAALSAREALAFGVSLCLLVGQIFALVRVGDRFDLLAENPFEPNAWDERGSSGAEGPSARRRNAGIAVFLLGLVGALVVTVAVLDWLLGL